MGTMTRKLFIRETKRLKCHRNLSASCILKNNEEFVVKSTLPDIIVPQARFFDYVLKESASFKNHIALESAETKKTYTYAQLEKNVTTFATSLLKKLGLKPGDVVAVMLPNSPEFPVVAFGTIHAGCILTTVNPIYKEYEITHQINLTEPKVIVTLPECYDNVRKGMQNAKNNSKIVLIDDPSQPVPNGVIRYSEIAEKGEVDFALLDKIEKKDDDVACIPFSSGTTGFPKGVEITYKNLKASSACMESKEVCYPHLTQGNIQDILPCFLPFFHIYGLVVTLIGHMAKGCKLITMSKFSASMYLDILKNEDCSLLYIVPPVGDGNRFPSSGPSACLLNSCNKKKLPRANNGEGISCRDQICKSATLQESKDIEFNQGFGATETTSLTTSTFKGSKNVDYSACGVPMAGFKLKFADPATGKFVPIGESGEMYIKSPTIMKGYHKNPTATAESLTEDGYFKSGDLGYYKPGVGLFITDRIKELIKVKGMQVAPAELESILRSHPAVADAAVIGVPHEFYGEAPKAFIIRKKDVKTTEEELQNFVANKVSVYKKIEEVMFVDAIPKTASGKILRKDLKAMYA
ncbi:hypothetical protein K1T71_008160 [Dendrolimus kikuchii]|uniref:Uncharacterized protein n=1 Tax=Dendrolimus kikuchii TaxID=765133 RepID=A0ACC1CWM1_9NEOP|nr:hypothetical protein K1T71_008160 [Dendrolimus kikuchii]